MIKTKRKLTLRTETIRALRCFELGEPRGGAAADQTQGGGCPARPAAEATYTTCPTTTNPA
jgi:hypothetical protein